MDVRIERQARGIVHAIPRPASGQPPASRASAADVPATDVVRCERRRRHRELEHRARRRLLRQLRPAAQRHHGVGRHQVASRQRCDRDAPAGRRSRRRAPDDARRGPPRPRRVPARRLGRGAPASAARGRRARTDPHHRRRSWPKPRPHRPYAPPRCNRMSGAAARREHPGWASMRSANAANGVLVVVVMLRARRVREQRRARRVDDPSGVRDVADHECPHQHAPGPAHDRARQSGRRRPARATHADVVAQRGEVDLPAHVRLHRGLARRAWRRSCRT